MAGKRTATSELNHDNWDQDEDVEDAGTFQRATDESLKRRIIKTARRRNPISSVRSTDPENKSAFTNFTAFTKTPASVPAAFSFLSNTAQPKTNGTNDGKEGGGTEKEKPSLLFKSSDNTSSVLPKTPSTTAKDACEKSNDYFSKLKGLNESVSNWIKKHVDANPLINLQPIFKDYEKYFKELEKAENTKAKLDEKSVRTEKKETMPTKSTFVFKAAENVPDSTSEKAQLGSKETGTKRTGKFSFDSTITSTCEKPTFGFSNTATSNTFSFANSDISASTSTTLTAPSFSFGSNASTSSGSGFSFSSAKPFTFTNVAQPSSTNEPSKENNAKEEDNEPPKVEFTPVMEKDHLFTTRCKVFVKKDGNYSDRGVGNLFLKSVENSKKVQLIVRADTNLGNLLCNFILSENVPTKRMGKKDVMLVCLPTPDFKPPPIPILLRVKSTEEADKLLETLEKYKK